MRAHPVILLGAGEHARVVADAALASGAWQLAGFAAPHDEPGGVGGSRWLGDDAAVRTLLERTPEGDRPSLVLAFGAPAAARRATVDRFPDVAWAAIVHPAAWVSPAASVEPGAVILAGAVVNSGARVGAHAIVNSGSVVEHDVVVGAFAHVAPGAVLGGGASVGDDAHIGLGAAVRDHVAIGRGALVGMGAVVVADVPEATVVMGNPARPARNADV